MTAVIIFLILLLIVVVIIQWSKVSDLAASLRGRDEVELQGNNRTAFWLLAFMVVFLIFCVVSAIAYKNQMLGYGPHSAASEHGSSLDGLFNTTLFWTGIVFVLTHIALFWFAYKYRAQPGRKAFYFPHNNLLEVVWTIVPLIVLTYLVISGLIVWNEVMSDYDPDEDYLEIEATGYQFAWALRYPGADNKIGTKNFRLIDVATNPLGQDWNDVKNLDDIHANELVLPVGKKVRVRITSRDVLHNFYLPHFRVKMDAIPGLPTHFIFTPVKTTEMNREELSKYPEYQVPADPSEPDGPKKWEAFDYELACAELCGKGHYSMRKLVKVVTQEEYEAWLAQQPSYYMQSIRNTDADPFKGQLIDIEIRERAQILSGAIDGAVKSVDDTSDDIIRLENVFFQTGSAELEVDSKYELNHLAGLLKDTYKSIDVELGGHTDNTGDARANEALSQARAESVLNYLAGQGVSNDRMNAKGYGQRNPVETNDTPEGRQMNRRTELKIISQ